MGILNKHPISTKHSVQKSCIYYHLFLDQDSLLQNNLTQPYWEPCVGTKTSGSTLFIIYPTSNSVDVPE